MNAVRLVAECVFLAGTLDALCPTFGLLAIGKARTRCRGLSGSRLLLIEY